MADNSKHDDGTSKNGPVMMRDRRLLLCDCEGSMPIDGARLAKALDVETTPHIHSHLCRVEVENYTAGLADGAPLLVGCTQEAPLFRELADDAGAQNDLLFVNLRERAGWCSQPSRTTPKLAALLAEAALDIRPAGTITLNSQGVCLVYGSDQVALDAARKLASRLNVTLLLTGAGDALPPSIADVPVHGGTISQVSGHFGAFEVSVANYTALTPSSRQELVFSEASGSAQSGCDLILDLSGGAPLVPGPDHRDGYFRVDPGSPSAVAEALFEISDMVGEFEKPIYVRHDPAICAHARNGKTGCTRCLDLCPAAAIAPAGDVVEFDPAICGGCGACAAACPSGAVSYDYPRRDEIVRRIQTLTTVYGGAGGKRAHLLIHDERRGSEMISALARYGRGLPANLLPLSVNQVTSIGHEVLTAALASGIEQIFLLTHPEQSGELSGLEAEVTLANAFMAALGHDGQRVHLLNEQDPDTVETLIHDAAKLTGLKGAPFTAPAGKRELSRLALLELNRQSPEAREIVPLPEGAPYGRIHIDAGKCTMCLACVSSCPAGALQDNPTAPQVRFIEQACVQCGLCRTTCPENAVKLEPRYNFTNDALSAVVLNEEEPYPCIRCGAPFGTRSMVERVVEKLAGKHWMFQQEGSADLIRMCDDCRVIAQAETTGDPFAAGTRPAVRTTQDYFDEIDAGKADPAAGLSAEDFLKKK